MSSEEISSSPSLVDSTLTRRAALGVGLGGVALFSAACSGGGGSSGTPSGGGPVPPTAQSELELLLSRVTYGHDAATHARAVDLGYEAWLEEQLAPETIADGACDVLLAGFPTLTLSSKQNYEQYYAQGNAARIALELRAATMLRAAFSKRQLFERVVEFWSDHFNVDQSDSLQNVLKTQDDRDVVRAHALGKFPDLLRASARGAAMSFYLGNYRNTATAPNENYGREIMELHSLGVGNYSESDVKAVARCFTGWGFQQTNSPGFGAFHFDPARHDDSAKVVLGHVIPAGGGVNDGEIVLDLLVNHPATAQFLARKMCRWFLSYEPSTNLVDAVAAAYTQTGGDIKAMLRVVLAKSSMTWALTQPAKMKRPFHLAASILRSTPFTITDATRLSTELGHMGHETFLWPSPNGYPDSSSAWGLGMLMRWTFASRLFAGDVAGVAFDPASVFANVPVVELARRADVILSGSRLSPTEVVAIQAYVDGAGGVDAALQREVMALAASSPSFQTY